MGSVADLARLRSSRRACGSERPLIADDSIDVIVSNCVLNLVRPEDKRAAVRRDVPGAEARRPSRDLGHRQRRGGARAPGPRPGSLERLRVRRVSRRRISPRVRRSQVPRHHIEDFSAKPYRTVEGVEFRAVTVTAYKGKEGPCIERNQAVIYRGPWKQVLDDDGHTLERGARMAVCDKTFTALFATAVCRPVHPRSAARRDRGRRRRDLRLCARPQTPSAGDQRARLRRDHGCRRRLRARLELLLLAASSPRFVDGGEEHPAPDESSAPHATRRDQRSEFTGGGPTASVGGGPTAPTGGGPAAPIGGGPAAPSGGLPAAFAGGVPSAPSKRRAGAAGGRPSAPACARARRPRRPPRRAVPGATPPDGGRTAAPACASTRRVTPRGRARQHGVALRAPRDRHRRDGDRRHRDGMLHRPSFQ